jgi:hypothetical protein
MQHDDVISFIRMNQKSGQSDKTILSVSKTNALSLEEGLEDLLLMPCSRNA